MILSLFTLFHVLLSLAGIGTGLVVVAGMLSGKSWRAMTQWFLATTVATSLTGFFFPYHGITPGIVVGLISCAVLGLAYFALRSGWTVTYIVSATVALYFNVFVLVVQLFEKVPALHELAPTQSEGPFKAAQLVVLVGFITLGVMAVRKRRTTGLSPVQS